MHRAVLCVALLFLCGCGAPRETYTVIHGAWLADDGTSLDLFAESGVATLSGSSFAAAWNHRSDTLSVWRLDRRSGELRRLAERPTPPDFIAFYGPAAPEPWSSMLRQGGELRGVPLPDCSAGLTLCAIRRAPQPYVIRDELEGRNHGLGVVDPATGVSVTGRGRKLVAEPWSLRTSTDIARARGEAHAGTAARAFAAARAHLVETLTKTGALPTSRSATIIDVAVAGGLEGMTPEYAVEPGGVLTARLQYGNDPPVSLRWIPQAAPAGAAADADAAVAYACEADRADLAQRIAGCRYRPHLETLDPELVYLVNNQAALEASAARDPAFERARRGVTFGVRSYDADAKLTWVACLGLPGTRLGGCHLQRGDTECIVSLPLLCMKPDATHAMRPLDRGLEGRRLASRIAASRPVRAADLSSRDQADARCADEFGAGWRVARWGDHGDGFIAEGVIEPVSRLWIDVEEVSAANCWSPR